MRTDEKLATAFLQKHPEVAARVLETMDTSLAAEVLDATPSRVAATVVNRMLLTSSAELARQLSAKSVAALLENLPVLTGAALLRQLPEPAREDALRGVKASRTTALRLLLRYPESAVGAWMTPGCPG